MEITTLQREQGVSTNQGEERGNMAERIVLAGPSISRRMLCPSHFLTYRFSNHLLGGGTTRENNTTTSTLIVEGREKKGEQEDS